MPIATNDSPKQVAISGNIPASDGKTTLPLFAGAGWRVEITQRGKFWQWRKGSGNERQSRYGGKFNELSSARQAQYAKNKLTHSRANVGDIARRAEVLPIGGVVD